MKLAARISIAAMASAGVLGNSDTGRPVTVYFQDRADVRIEIKTPARGLASQMFARVLSRK
jgi:hypothetical protein